MPQPPPSDGRQTRSPSDSNPARIHTHSGNHPRPDLPRRHLPKGPDQKPTQSHLADHHYQCLQATDWYQQHTRDRRLRDHYRRLGQLDLLPADQSHTDFRRHQTTHRYHHPCPPYPRYHRHRNLDTPEDPAASHLRDPDSRHRPCRSTLDRSHSGTLPGWSAHHHQYSALHRMHRRG